MNHLVDSHFFDKEFFFKLIDNFEAGACILKLPEKEIVFCNNAWINLFNFDDTSIIDMKQMISIRKHKLTTEKIAYIDKIVIEKGIYSETVEYISLKGVEFLGKLTIKPLKVDNVTYYLATIEKKDELRNNESIIKQNINRYEALFNHASMGIVVVNSHAKILSVNPFALKLFGYTSNELIGRQIELLIPMRFHHKHVAHRNGYTKKPNSRPMGAGMDLFAIRKDGTEFPVEVSLGNYDNNGEQNVIAFISDIAIRKKAELEIEKLNDDLEGAIEQRTHELTETMHELEKSKEELSISLAKEKELSELKSRFVSMASHEFRTPLSTVLSSSYLIQKYLTEEDQPKREKHLQRIISSVNMLTDILNDFLSVGKIEEGKIQVRLSEFNVEKHVKTITTEIINNLKKGQTIMYKHKGDDNVFMDPSLFKHIIMNLVSNASKFSPEDTPIEINTVGEKNKLKLSVKDKGIGISVDDQKHLMERFFRGTNAANIQGTGLGLHIIAKYAELMHGEVTCESELEKGTEFKIIFKKN
jgi:PAS domain S-box-containing protein